MRIVFRVLSLLIVVAIVGVLAKKQLGSGTAPSTPAAAVEGAPTVQGTPKQQVDQFKKAAEAAVQQPRPAEDSTK